MSKILLIYEDFPEMLQAETYLRKVGFDVLGINNELSLNEKLLSFNPDVIVGYGQGSKVNSVSIGKKLKNQNKLQAKVVLVFQKDNRPPPVEFMALKVDGVLEYPVAPPKMIQVLAKFCGLAEEALLEKFYRHRHVEAKTESVKQGAKQPSAVIRLGEYRDNPKNKERISRYGNLKSSAGFSEKDTMDRVDAKARHQELQKDWQVDQMEPLDEEKREFTRALFKKRS